MQKRHIVHKPHKQRKVSHNLYLGIIILLVLIAGLYYLSAKAKGEVAATVNGENIYAKRVDALYNSLPDGSKLTKTEILNRVINTKVLVDYIKKNGYTLNDSTFETMLASQLKSNNLTQAELIKNLELQGATLDDVRETFLIQSFVDAVVKPKLKVTVSQIAQFKQQNNATGLTDIQIFNILYTNQQKVVIDSIVKAHKPEMNIVILKTYQQ